MKSNHAVVFNEFYYKVRYFMKTSEKFDFIKNKYQGSIASEVWLLPIHGQNQNFGLMK